MSVSPRMTGDVTLAHAFGSVEQHKLTSLERCDQNVDNK